MATLKIKMAAKGDVYTVTMSNVTSKLSGVYKCTARNAGGTVSHTANVTIVGQYP